MSKTAGIFWICIWHFPKHIKLSLQFLAIQQWPLQKKYMWISVTIKTRLLKKTCRASPTLLKYNMKCAKPSLRFDQSLCDSVGVCVGEMSREAGIANSVFSIILTTPQSTSINQYCFCNNENSLFIIENTSHILLIKESRYSNFIQIDFCATII